jgi:hypothetical protein
MRTGLQFFYRSMKENDSSPFVLLLCAMIEHLSVLLFLYVLTLTNSFSKQGIIANCAFDKKFVIYYMVLQWLVTLLRSVYYVMTLAV